MFPYVAGNLRKSSATSHLISRFAQSDADCDALTLELFSPFQHTRKRARQVLDLVDSHNHFNFWKPDVLRGERVQELRDVSKGNPKTQSMCLAFFKSWGPLRQGIGSLTGVADAVEAAWSAPLRSYPPSLEPTRRYARLLSRTLHEQEALAGHSEARLWPLDQDPLAQIVTSADGSGLPRGRNSNDHSEDLEYEIDEQSLAQLVARADGAALPLGRNIDGSRRARFHEESPEETEVRRRRREAMVFHEGSGALGRDDIIQPRSRMP